MKKEGKCLLKKRELGPPPPGGGGEGVSYLTAFVKQAKMRAK